MHFEEGLSARYKVGDSAKLVTKGIRGKTASEKLTEEGLVKFSARVAIQVYFRFLSIFQGEPSNKVKRTIKNIMHITIKNE